MCLSHWVYSNSDPSTCNPDTSKALNSQRGKRYNEQISMTQNTWKRKNFKNDRKGEKTTRWFWRAEEDQGKKMWKKRRRIRVSKLPSICFLVTSLEHILDTSIAQASDDPFRLSESHLHDSIVQHHLKILTKKELQKSPHLYDITEINFEEFQNHQQILMAFQDSELQNHLILMGILTRWT
jgi:hypothetical protein